MTEILVYLTLLLSFVTFSAFGFDKRRARTGGKRIPERTLLTLSWAGGLGGGWLGMTVFRHKTQKTSFKVKMVVVSILNLLWALIWLLVV
jgi:uncharacterized membrane protein YsdA (DUF1294 family)